MNSMPQSAEQARVLATGKLPDYPFIPQSFTHPNGLRQSYLDEGPRDGEAVVTYPDGARYEGHFVGGIREGKGRLTMPGGLSLHTPARPVG